MYGVPTLVAAFCLGVLIGYFLNATACRLSGKLKTKNIIAGVVVFVWAFQNLASVLLPEFSVDNLVNVIMAMVAGAFFEGSIHELLTRIKK